MRKIDEVLKQYSFYDKNINVLEFGNGNINKTYLVKKDDWYIIQKINNKVFTNPEEVIYNINLLSQYCKDNNKNVNVIELVANKEGEYITKTRHCEDDYFRCYKYINSNVIDKERVNYNHLYEAGRIIGTFLKEFNDLDYRLLKETIKDFHNTVLRYNRFIAVVNEDKYFRKRLANNEVNKLIKYRYLLQSVNYKMPVRVCHNDTKLNNILFDNYGKGVALIDMDTVMPGFLIYDYADGLRSLISNVQEDDKNIEKIEININNFYYYTKGFLESVIDIITMTEFFSLVKGLEIITYECSLRFLTDYIENDVYFKTDYCSHNLVRTKNQIKLLEEIINHEKDFEKSIIKILLEIKSK